VDGRYAKIFKTCGRISADSLMLSNGTASFWWKFCDQTTTLINPAKIWATVDGISSDSIPMHVNNGPARKIRITPASQTTLIGNTLAVKATVRDSLGNLVIDQSGTVIFESSLGTISPMMAGTDLNGEAHAELSPGTQAGNAILKATLGGSTFVDSTVVRILATTAGSIQLTVSNSSPQVDGTGGQSWSQLRAYVFDVHGNAVPDGQLVTFRIVAAPDQLCYINHSGSIEATAVTAGGLAVATFNSGLQPGPVVIRATAVDTTSGVVYTAQVSNISVVAGPPAHLDIQPTNVAVDADPAWDAQIVAIVSDLYHNPVGDGVAVFFEVDDSAAVLSDTVVTGNGPHRQGAAYTWIRYTSAATNMIVHISSRTAGGEGVESVNATIAYQLPLQQPTISLYCLPNTWQYTAAGGGPCNILCEAVVVDGHHWPVNDVKVLYGAMRGRFYLHDTRDINQNYQYTGPNQGEDFEPGHVKMYLIEDMQWIFPDQNSTEITSDIQVEVEGYPDAIDSQVINFRRRSGGTSAPGN
jgi:hypothetical protein